jgi:hypothetical protein
VSAYEIYTSKVHVLKDTSVRYTPVGRHASFVDINRLQVCRSYVSNSDKHDLSYDIHLIGMIYRRYAPHKHDLS